jgi:hypothetical protein
MGEVKSLKFGENPKRTIPSEPEKGRVTTMFKSRREFKGAVIGMVMGDGCIPYLQGQSKTHIFDMNHCLKQREYALFKAGVLEYLTKVRVYEPPGTHKIRVTTRSHPLYSKLYSHFYHNRRKTIDEHLMKCLTPMGLAFLYQDDGSLCRHENAMAVTISSYCNNKVEMDFVAYWLAKRFGFEFRVNAMRRDKNGGQAYWRMRLRMKDREKFFDMICPYVEPSMAYKITPDDDWEQKLYHDKSTHVCEYCGKQFQRMWKRRERPNRFCSHTCYTTFKHNGGSQLIALAG